MNSTQMSGRKPETSPIQPSPRLYYSLHGKCSVRLLRIWPERPRPRPYGVQASVTMTQATTAHVSALGLLLARRLIILRPELFNRCLRFI